MATTHTARTVHHTVSEDGPPAPVAGNVRTQRATCGTSAGAISTSTTAVPATGPGSPVRVRTTHATAKPNSTLPASARPAAAQGSACPRRAAATVLLPICFALLAAAAAFTLDEPASLVVDVTPTGPARRTQIRAVALLAPLAAGFRYRSTRTALTPVSRVRHPPLTLSLLVDADTSQ